MTRAAPFKWLAMTFAMLLALQLVQPVPPVAVLPGDGPIGEHVDVPPHIDALLRRACYDCHSDETRWPWYARVSPISWLVARDVQHGRSNLDFSSWSTDPVREPTPSQRLRWMCEDVQENIMPSRLYRLVHGEARLDAAQKEELCAWTRGALDRLGEAPREQPF